MVEDKADEVVLECEVSNRGGLALYQNLGFLRDKRLVRYSPCAKSALDLVSSQMPIHTWTNGLADSHTSPCRPPADYSVP